MDVHHKFFRPCEDLNLGAFKENNESNGEQFAEANSYVSFNFTHHIL